MYLYINQNLSQLAKVDKERGTFSIFLAPDLDKNNGVFTLRLVDMGIFGCKNLQKGSKIYATLDGIIDVFFNEQKLPILTDFVYGQNQKIDTKIISLSVTPINLLNFHLINFEGGDIALSDTFSFYCCFEVM